jgi:hypothetical protein
MKLTQLLQCAAQERRGLKSLALTVHFKHPNLRMNGYEILSRASAFLLGVDAKDKLDSLQEVGKGPYDHLDAAEERRMFRELKHVRGTTPITPVDGRELLDAGWLEFVPREVRPRVHIVCSSHVVAPYLWKEYYPQDWLSVIRQEHCKFSLEVYDTNLQSDALATIDINSQPVHHPEGRDIGKCMIWRYCAHATPQARASHILRSSSAFQGRRRGFGYPSKRRGHNSFFAG